MSILRKLKNKIVDDLIPNELKSPEGAIAAAVLAADQFGIPGTDIGGNKRVTGTIADILFGTKKPVDPSSETPVYERSGGITGAVKDVLGTKIGTGENEKTLGSTLLSGILSPAGLSIGAGLLAGAFAKDKEDPLYTGQSVGLNLRDIRKLANISDPRTGAAIGLNFLPETRFRQFSPEQMAETFAATAPRDFTEDRTPAQDGGLIKEAEKYATQKQSEFLKNVDMNNIPRTGNLQREQERAYENAYREYMERNKKAEGGIMGDQKDFEQFLQDMKERDMGRMQDQILRDFENYMKRKKMIESLPEAKDGGIMKMAKGGMMDMGGMEMDLRGGGFVPMGAKEKADDVPARLSKNEFVFTADAVRAAGGGSIDKGADKMYATMKALENKVA